MHAALIGSSGGGTATLGHTLHSEFVNTIVQELGSISEPASLKTVLFVSLDGGKGMDSAMDEDPATLYHLSDGTQRSVHGTLKEINEHVKELEAVLADDIRRGEIHALISVSCKVSLFSQTLKAASDKHLPVTGTGGASLSLASSEYNIRLVGNAGGSVATTPLTKAISFAHALARSWGLQYMPWDSSSSLNRAQKHYPTWKSVLNSCLPAFWGVALCKRLLVNHIGDWLANSDMLLEVLETHALPTCCAVIMASSRRASPSVLMGSALAGIACRKTVLGGLLAGYLVPFLEERLLYKCIIHWGFPATMTNLLTTGFVGAFVAVVMAPISVYLSSMTHLFRTLVISILTEPRIDLFEELLRLLVLCVLGSLFCYGSKIGLYHSICLPLTLVDMELGDASIFGAMDLLTLVMVSSGICFGVWVAGESKDVSLAKRGLTINLLCGDFIEACYPFMEQNAIINVGGYLASACSVGLLSSGCMSSAYLPFPIALWLAEDWRLLLFASVVAMGISFLATVANYSMPGQKIKKLL